jgi:hypothetical protein
MSKAKPKGVGGVSSSAFISPWLLALYPAEPWGLGVTRGVVMDQAALAEGYPQFDGIFYHFNQLSAPLKVMDNEFPVEVNAPLGRCEVFFTGLWARSLAILEVAA